MTNPARRQPALVGRVDSTGTRPEFRSLTFTPPPPVGGLLRTRGVGGVDGANQTTADP